MSNTPETSAGKTPSPSLEENEQNMVRAAGHGQTKPQEKPADANLGQGPLRQPLFDSTHGCYEI